MYKRTRDSDRNRWTEGINTALDQNPSVVGRGGTRGLFARAAIRAHATRNHAIRTLRGRCLRFFINQQRFYL